MIEPNILAFQNAALLEALADPALRHLTTIAALAEHLGKDKSNLRKTMALLVEADLLLADPLQHGLTVNGHAQLAAFKRAQHGGERRKSRGRWPLDKLQRNPANRTIDPDAVLGLADTIVSAGDILQPLTLSPPDAHGVRTIWIGERRWIAATRLLQLGQLPDALVEGVPFVEREANAGEAAVITLIENTARQDLTPWEDAQQLRRAAEAHPDWSASELARRIGRAREGDRGGVRDVQQKLKIAREATPEAIARYEADPAAPRAWEDLRDSVTQPKPREPEIVTTKAQRLALAELLDKAGGAVGVDVEILPAAHNAEGARLTQYGLAVLTRNDRGDTARVTEAGRAYLEAERLTSRVEYVRETLGFPAGWGVNRYRTEWLNTLPKAQEAKAPRDAETRALAGIEPITATPAPAISTGTIPMEGFEPKPLSFSQAVIDEALAKGRPGDRAAKLSGTTTIEGEAWPTEATETLRTPWQGYPSARIELYRSDAGRWGCSLSTVRGGPSHGGQGDATGVWTDDPIFPDRHGVLRHAARQIRKRIDECLTPKLQAWLEELTNPAGDPLVVGGLRRLNAESATEAKYRLGIKKRPVANYGGAKGEGPAPKPSPATPSTTEHPTNRVLRLIAEERYRQVTEAGYAPEHDDVQNDENELALAAEAYIESAIGAHDPAGAWPSTWDADAFKPRTPKEDLIRAGALIVAELERLHRAEASR